MSVQVQENEKATRYIGLLQAARLNATWSEVPELVRKVDKHAPHRKCLTLTATCEAQIASHSSGQARRPGTASSAASFNSLLDITPKLIQQIDQEQTYFEDAFQANVCLHEVYFLCSEWATVRAGLDKDVWQQVDRYSNNRQDISPNTRLAIIKSGYLLGVVSEQHNEFDKAAKAYRDALPASNNAPINLLGAHEYRTWVERLMGRICTLQSNQGNTSSLSAANAALVSFRAWARIWEHATPRNYVAPSYSLGPFDISRRDVWSLYYHFLSFVLANNLVYTQSADQPLAFFSPDIPSQELASLRVRQRNELKHVETAYETLLLDETRFPQASQSNEEVEQWAQQVVTNWSVLCGPQWREYDLGKGGKAAIGRGVLDILYRAATKTFHSTTILRHLFTAHASLAEFDLAIKAFDSYSDIITRAKSRAEKTGLHEIGLDTDDLVILTATQAIDILCKYGSLSEGEKAIEVAKRLSVWLQQQRPTSSTSSATKESTSYSEKPATEAVVSAGTLVAAYRSVGESQANWARLTYDPVQRSEFREKAVKSLRRAADLSPNGNVDPSTALQLATVLAESRELPAAIQVVKKALAASSQDEDDDPEYDTTSGAFAREKQLIPLWHLMSLLLTARGEYENAVQICDAAFEQFEGPEMLFGDLRDEVPNSTEKAKSQGLIHQMEDFEKEGLLQIRITQLALTEILETPEAAVDASSELLAVYNRLFGTQNVDMTTPQTNATPVIPSAAPNLAPPLKSASTLRSISGSILGRNRTVRKNVDKTAYDQAGPTTTPGTGQTGGAPVSIQVTNEDGVSSEKHHKHHLPHHLPLHPFKHHAHHGDSGAPRPNTASTASQDLPTDAPLKSTSSGAQGGADLQPTSSQQDLPPIPHNIDHSKQPAPMGYTGELSSQDLRLPAPHPSSSAVPRPRFPTAQQKRHTTSLLVDVWLYIAGQYIRAELFDDAEDAIDEAHKLTDGFQLELAKVDSSARAFDERGWGGGKSVNRLWADVWAERASLAALKSSPHDALSAYERALSHYPDHPAAIVGISDILLDIYEQKIPAEISDSPIPPPSEQDSTQASPSPATLTRLAARDRAYMLLNTLTRMGEGWDDSEAWSMLARAHELSGQVDRARECLWFLVELEDGRPVRPWNVVSSAF